jgi:hypothetical protein
MQQYELRVQYFAKLPVTTVVAAVRSSVDGLDAQYNVADEITLEAIADSVTAAVNRRVAAADRTSFDLSEAGRCTRIDSAPALFRDRSAFLDSMGIYAARRQTRDEAVEELARIREELGTIWTREGGPSGGSLRMRLDSALSAIAGAEPSNEYPFIGRADVDGVLATADDPDAMAPSAALQRLRGMIAATRRPTPPSPTIRADVLEHLSDLVAELTVLAGAQDRASAEQRVLEATLSWASNEVATNPQEVLNPTYLLALVSNEITATSAAPSKIEDLRVGTAFAYGGVMPGINSGPGSDTDFAAFLLIRLRLFGYADHDLPTPYTYSGRGGRIALDVGALFKSTVRYKGQELRAGLGELTPALGLSYEFEPRITAHIGGMVYRQASPNPFNANRLGRARIAPYLLLGFDFDLVNEIKELGRP